MSAFTDKIGVSIERLAFLINNLFAEKLSLLISGSGSLERVPAMKKTLFAQFVALATRSTTLTRANSFVIIFQSF